MIIQDVLNVILTMRFKMKNAICKLITVIHINLLEIVKIVKMGMNYRIIYVTL